MSPDHFLEQKPSHLGRQQEQVALSVAAVADGDALVARGGLVTGGLCPQSADVQDVSRWLAGEIAAGQELSERDLRLDLSAKSVGCRTVGAEHFY